MIELSILDLFKNGQLGDVRLGMTQEEVEAIWGKLDAVGGSSSKYKRPRIWLYDNIELHWYTQANTLEMVFLERFNSARGGQIVNLDSWQIVEGLPFVVTEALLLSENIEFKKLTGDSLIETHKIIQLSSGVQLTFAQNGNGFGLVAVAISIHFERFC